MPHIPSPLSNAVRDTAIIPGVSPLKHLSRNVGYTIPPTLRNAFCCGSPTAYTAVGGSRVVGGMLLSGCFLQSWRGRDAGNNRLHLCSALFYHYIGVRLVSLYHIVRYCASYLCTKFQKIFLSAPYAERVCDFCYFMRLSNKRRNVFFIASEETWVVLTYITNLIFTKRKN